MFGATQTVARSGNPRQGPRERKEMAMPKTKKAKQGVQVYRGVKIPEHGNGYRPQIMRNGVMHRKTCETIELAQNFIDSVLDTVDRNEQPLTPMEMREARQAYAMLPENMGLLEAVRTLTTAMELLPDKVGVMDAARFYAKAAPDGQQKGPVTLSAAFERYLAVKSGKDYDLRHAAIVNIRSRVGALACSSLGDKELGEVTKEDLTSWLDKKKVSKPGSPDRGKPISKTTRDNYRRAWKAFFSWAVDEGYLYKNPLAMMRLKVDKDDQVDALTVKQVRKLMEAVEQVEPGDQL